MASSTGEQARAFCERNVRSEGFGPRRSDSTSSSPAAKKEHLSSLSYDRREQKECLSPPSTRCARSSSLRGGIVSLTPFVSRVGNSAIYQNRPAYNTDKHPSEIWEVTCLKMLDWLKSCSEAKGRGAEVIVMPLEKRGPEGMPILFMLYDKLIA